jgi:signal transduction histidine kinase
VAAVVTVLGLGAGLAVALPGLSADLKNLVNTWAYSAASLGSGAVLLAAAGTHRGRRRQAWVLLGLGVLFWGIAEAGSEAYWATGREVPYPGWVDIFYLLGYPLLGAGVLRLPRPRLGAFERTRSALDAATGIVALSLVAWLVYLDKAIVFDPAASMLENWTNALYPIGDVILLLAVLGIAFRRTERHSGRELLLLGVALSLNAIADMVYFALVSTNGYANGMWLDGLWLLGYAAFAGAAWLCLRPPGPAVERPARGLGRLTVAYTPVLALLAVVLESEPSGRRFVTLAWVGLAALIVVRQWVANLETKELAENGRDAILASVSHDLRTPLAAVQGYSQLLAEGWDQYDPGERAEMLQTVLDQAVHLGRIVTDIIDVTRGRAPSVVLQPQACLAARLLHRAVGALPPAVAAQVTVRADPGLALDADGERVHQVLVNLLNNAARYGRPPFLVSAEARGSAVVFRVHDAGPGVPKRFEASIWERFERGAFRDDPAGGGLGIGLPIAKALVEAHGGSIRHQRSELLGGACFEFTLPARQARSMNSLEAAPAPAPALPAPVA